MNTYKEDHDLRKAKVVEYLSRTIQFLEGQENTADTVTALKDYRRNVEEGLFSIVLVGEFSAGKSTFLNALMHKRILPSFSSETTATVNFLRHASQAPDNETTGIVYYKDGRKTAISGELSPDVLEKIVSTRGDKGEEEDEKIATSVDHVDLFLNSSLLQDGVMLVDSPGLGGVADHHREITERQIQASHASIFMFSAHQPGKNTDFEYLKDLKSQSGNIFFVLNMIDVIKPEEQSLEEVENVLRNSYRKKFPEEKTLPKIWPVSAEAALTARDSSMKTYKTETVSTQERRSQLEEMSRLGAFEKRLWQYLTQGERSREQLMGPVERCLAVLEEQRGYYQKQIDLLKEAQSAEELTEQKSKLEEEIQDLQQSRRSISPELRSEVQKALEAAKDSGEAGCKRIHDEIKMTVENMDNTEELSEYASSLQHLLDVRYQRIGTKMKDGLREDLLRIVQNEYDTWFEDLEERMEQNTGQLNIQLNAGPLVLTQREISNNLARFEEWCDSKQEEIRKLEADADRLEEDSFEAKLADKKLEAAKSELKALNERRAYIHDSFVVPDITYRTEEVQHKEWRKGVFGLLTTVLFGRKNVTDFKTVENRNAHDDAEKRQKEREAIMAKEEERIREEIRSLPVPVKSGEQLERQAVRLREKQLKAEQEYADRQRQFMEDMKKNSEKACRNIRNEILLYVDETGDIYKEALDRTLGKMKDGCIKAVRDLINVNLEQQLEHSRKKLDELIHLIETEGDERAKELQLSVEREEAARVLLAQGAELSGMLDAQMQDQVDQEAL